MDGSGARAGAPGCMQKKGRLQERGPVALPRGSAQPGSARRGHLRAAPQHEGCLIPLPPGRGDPSIPPRLFILCLAVAPICLALLMLPLQGQPSPLLPSALHVTLPQKLVAAYILGLLTMVFLRS